MITTTLHPALNSTIDNNVDGIEVNHHRLLADLVESTFPLVAIARDHGLNLAQLIAWTAQPAVRALLDAADDLARRIADHKAVQGRAGAVETLIRHATGLCDTPRDRDLASRAARTLVRITNPAARPRITRHKSTPRSVDSSIQAPPQSDAPESREPVSVRARSAATGQPATTPLEAAFEPADYTSMSSTIQLAHVTPPVLATTDRSG